MNATEPDFPKPEDSALAAALSRRIPIPDHILGRLHADREQILAGRAATEERVIRLVPAIDARPAVKRAAFRPWLAAAAAITVAALVTWQFWLRAPAVIAGISPSGEVASQRPEIVWENAIGKSYNVWILPEEGDYTTAPALFVAKGVRSPVSFESLKPGKGAPLGMTSLSPETDYRVLICYADAAKDPVGERLAGTPVKFRVAAGPSK